MKVIILSIVMLLSSGCMHKDFKALSLYLNKHKYTPKQITILNATTPAEISKQMSDKGFNITSPMLIRAFKTEMKLELWIKNTYSNQYNLFKSYNICQKSGKLGPKEMEGDKQTPEGFYNVTQERLNPNSKYFLSFNIGFPNEYDKSLKRTGSNLMIHGNCLSVGCLAMKDNNIAEIYLILEQNFKSGNNSVPVHIYPFRMTDENMDLRKNYRWHSFWQNIKQGYDYFEKHHVPAHATAKNGNYVFNKDEYD